MNILIVRHGQTDYNKERKLQGWTDNPLNENGKQQALRTKMKLEKEPIDIILCSPLTRAKQTAAIINANRKIPTIYDDRLRERDFGEFEGIAIADFKPYEVWSYKQDKQYEKAESTKDFLNRIYEFLEEIQKEYKGKNILIVAHAGVSIAISCYFEGIPEDDKLVDIRLKNGEYKKYTI